MAEDTTNTESSKSRLKIEGDIVEFMKDQLDISKQLRDVEQSIANKIKEAKQQRDLSREAVISASILRQIHPDTSTRQSLFAHHVAMYIR